ncbi:MAG: sterol desaturase [Saprospiraceae bacterium]|nr:MAG: sterol desaturase [Saprospiraceae bacterium]
METYAIALSYAIPGFIVLVAIESLLSRWMGMRVNEHMDTISSLSSGVTNTLKSLMGLTVVIISYEWMVGQFAVFNIQSSVALYVLAFIGLDFAGYWSHRFNHVVNLFWNRHIIHHSSEEFNLSCALRQSISAIVGIYFFLYIPMAIIGIPTHVIAVIAPIHFFAQFWYHTRLINKMGWLEYIIVTPSHHRVHHAINPQYIDKNFSEIFIIWDKLFGTFQAELKEVPPVYGITKPVNTWNPILINYMHLWQLSKDAWRTQKWWDKLRIWFMPTGWRPTDVIEQYPLEYTKDPYTREKYKTESSIALIVWSWSQLTVSLLFMYYMLVNIANFQFIGIVLFALFLMLSIFAYTTLMDGHRFALPAEIIKLATGLLLLYQMNEWAPISEVLPAMSTLLSIYLLVSLLVTVYFVVFELRTRRDNVSVSA